MESNEDDAKLLDPCIISLGKQSKKQIKKLKRGEGKLAAEVGEAIAEVLAVVGEEERIGNTLPIIVVVERKPKKTGWLGFTS